MPPVLPPRSARQASAGQATKIEALKGDRGCRRPELPPCPSPRKQDNVGRTRSDSGSSLDPASTSCPAPSSAWVHCHPQPWRVPSCAVGSWKKEILSAWCNQSYQEGVSREPAQLPSLGLCMGLKAGPGLAWQSASVQQLQIQGDFPPPDKFCNRRETGCEFQGLHAGEEQR